MCGEWYVPRLKLLSKRLRLEVIVVGDAKSQAIVFFAFLPMNEKYHVGCPC